MESISDIKYFKILESKLYIPDIIVVKRIYQQINWYRYIIRSQSKKKDTKRSQNMIKIWSLKGMIEEFWCDARNTWCNPNEHGKSGNQPTASKKTKKNSDRPTVLW